MSMYLKMFSPQDQILAALSEKQTANTFPRLSSQICFFCQYKSLKTNNSLMNKQSFLSRPCEISLKFF